MYFKRIEPCITGLGRDGQSDPKDGLETAFPNPIQAEHSLGPDNNFPNLLKPNRVQLSLQVITCLMVPRLLA